MVCHTSELMYIGRNQPGSCVKFTVLPNRDSAIWFTVPVIEKFCRIIPAMITTDMKGGRYATVCTNFLNFWDRSSLSISAKMMGIGKQNTNVRMPRTIVFWKACQKLGSLMKRVMYLKPTHFSPKMLPPG